MRVKIGENFSLFNKNGEWLAKIIKISNGKVEFSIREKLRNRENPVEIWLAFSPIKLNYSNFMIQKATELGVTKFIPIIFDRTIVRKMNQDRLKKIVVEACEQSNRINIPIIEKPQSLKNFLKLNQCNLIFTDLNSSNKKINVSKLTSKPICIIIGPEGDFSPGERELILKNRAVKPFTLSRNILRSDTAVISAISLVNFINNFN